MNIKYSRTVVTTIFTLLLALTAQFVEAASNPPVLPPTANAYGKSYAEWAAAWIEWAFPIPCSSNPIFDTTGAFAANGQSGKVWFLAGNNGGVTDRTVTIPVSKPLFFPIVIHYWVNAPEYGDPEWSQDQEAYVREYLKAYVATATPLTLEIDGHLVPNLNTFRFQSTVYTVELPPDKSDNSFGVDLLTGPHHGVADGYWVMLPPLSAGSHTIHFAGGFEADPPFSLDVTYHITVQPGPKGNKPLHP